MRDYRCTHCAKVTRLYIPMGKPGALGWVSCPHRVGATVRESGAPWMGAFGEMSKICDNFAPIEFFVQGSHVAQQAK